MVQIEQLDAHVDHDAQTADAGPGPVVLVNIFHVHPDHADELAAAWGDVLRRFKSQSGFISAQFHRGVAGSGTFLNYAVWESTAAYRAAFEDPRFQDLLITYPPETVATPHLFRKVAIADVCVA